MQPNAFLRTFWQMNIRPQVFVAMSFAPQYQTRFEDVIGPAIRGITVGNGRLEPCRVDLSKSGDSILTEIVDGIAHCRLVLADVSSIGRDSITGQSYRNGNVMYEVGIALACRLPHEVLLVRDDDEKFLFDVSTIPHKKIDFTNVTQARSELQEELMNRLREGNHVNDARVQKAISCLSGSEMLFLKRLETRAVGRVCVVSKPMGGLLLDNSLVVERLLDKGLLQLVGESEDGSPGYLLTPIGYVVAGVLQNRGLPRVVTRNAQ